MREREALDHRKTCINMNIQQYMEAHMHTHTVHRFQQVNTRATRSLQRVTQGTLVVHMPVVMSLGSIPHLFKAIMHIYNHKWRSDILQHLGITISDFSWIFPQVVSWIGNITCTNPTWNFYWAFPNCHTMHSAALSGSHYINQWHHCMLLIF